MEARRASVKEALNRDKKDASLNGRFINNGRFIKAEDQTSGRNGRFINQKRPNGQISYIWVAACRFHTVPCKEFISGQAELFLARAGKANGRLSRPASRNGRFIKADGRFIKAGNAQLQFYQQWQTYQGQAKGGLIRSAPLRLEGLGSLRAPVINVYKEPYKEVKEPL